MRSGQVLTGGIGVYVTGADTRGDVRTARWLSGDHGKLAALTASRIEDDIIAAGWPVGEVLGSEAALTSRYGVSRAVFREAVRLVEHHGAAQMRRGPSGGLVVHTPDAAAVVSAVVLYLEHAAPSVADIFFARRLVEPLAAALAAERITEGGIAQLRAVLEAERSGGDRQILSVEHNALHTTVAALAGNEALALFVTILAELTAYYATTRTGREEAREAAQTVTRAHSSITDAIIGGDAPAAQHRTDAHLVGAQEFMTPRRLGRPALGEADSKLAEVIAARIRRDLAGSGLLPGDVAGSENELLETYGVSRAVFREAIRLLEHHSVAAMRRGPGGGLVVLSPNPAASIEAAALYLDCRGAKAEDLHQVREALELGVIDLLAGKADDPRTMRQLSEALLASEHAPADDIAEPSNHLHIAMAAMAGNVVVDLLLQIAIALWARHTVTSADAPAEISATVTKTHHGIIDAIAAGDHSIARHRMRKHLTALTDWWS